MPKISVILPTYNGAPYLAEQIDSILGQTDPDLELLLLDDGSTDDTVERAQRIARRDPRVHVLDSDGNRGQGQRLSELFAAAQGRFVCISDQDDVWARDRNERLLAAIGDAAMAFGRSQLTDGEGRDRGLTILDSLGLSPDPSMRLNALFNPLVSGHATLARRDAISQAAFLGVLPFDQAMGIEALFGAGLRYVDGAVVYHRIHGDNQCNGAALSGRSTRMLSRSRVVTSFFDSGQMRLTLWLSLDFLGRSPVIDPPLRARFRRLARAAHEAWYASWRRLRDYNTPLRAALIEHLAPLAGCDADRRLFERSVLRVTAPPLAPRNLASSWDRLRDQYRRDRAPAPGGAG